MSEKTRDRIRQDGGKEGEDKVVDEKLKELNVDLGLEKEDNQDDDEKTGDDDKNTGDEEEKTEYEDESLEKEDENKEATIDLEDAENLDLDNDDLDIDDENLVKEKNFENKKDEDEKGYILDPEDKDTEIWGDDDVSEPGNPETEILTADRIFLIMKKEYR